MAASFSAPSSAALPLQSSVQKKKLFNQDQMGSSPLHATTARSSQTSSAAISRRSHRTSFSVTKPFNRSSPFRPEHGSPSSRRWISKCARWLVEPRKFAPNLVNKTPALLRARSEEHTSELQSLMRISYAVFCLKKKKHTNNENQNSNNAHTQQSIT